MGELIPKPWGNYSDWYRSESCVCKVISVDPGQRLSLQRHTQRSEVWMILEGDAMVSVESFAMTRRAGDIITIRRGEIHRLQNIGDTVLKVAEFQSGVCDEADIERLADDYERKN